MSEIENPMYTADPPEPEHYITSLEDLCNYFSADEPRLLNKRVYKGTDCGASISLHLEEKVYQSLGPIEGWENFECCGRKWQGGLNAKCPDCGKPHETRWVKKPLEVDEYRGPWLHNGENTLWEKLTMETPILGFTIQTIVEGSDRTVDSEEFVLPVAESEVDAWIKDMEAEASVEWENANNPMCTCGHRSDDHRWAEDPSAGIAGAVKGYECTNKDCDCKEFSEDEWYGVD